jgi:hypothetical protein
MVRISWVLKVSTFVIISGCEAVTPPPEPATAPEYLNCRSVPKALSVADAKVRSPGFSAPTEQAYWFDRRERLVKRAWDCKR